MKRKRRKLSFNELSCTTKVLNSFKTVEDSCLSPETEVHLKLGFTATRNPSWLSPSFFLFLHTIVLNLTADNHSLARTASSNFVHHRDRKKFWLSRKGIGYTCVSTTIFLPLRVSTPLPVESHQLKNYNVHSAKNLLELAKQYESWSVVAIMCGFNNSFIHPQHYTRWAYCQSPGVTPRYFYMILLCKC